MSTAETTDATETLVERFSLKALVEACLVLEEGEASRQGHRDRDDDGRRHPARARSPAPTSRAWTPCSRRSSAPQSEWGEGFEPPLVLRRLVAQGRLGKKSGQGFFPYPQPDDGQSRETIALETRGDVGIVWLNRPPANPLSPQVIRELTELWGEIDGKLRAVVFASSNIFTFSAGADIKEFTKMAPDKEGKELIDAGHGFMRSMERSSTVTIAAVNSLAFGGGCELAMACDFRIAAESASFGQPEINLGIIPGFGGTQRLPRLVGEAKALEMNLAGEPIDAYEALEAGLANRVVPDHELFDTALSWARKLAGQAPLAVEQIKQRLGRRRPGRGHRGREAGLRRRVRVRGREGGHRRLPRQAPADVQGQVDGPLVAC